MRKFVAGVVAAYAAMSVVEYLERHVSIEVKRPRPRASADRPEDRDLEDYDDVYFKSRREAHEVLNRMHQIMTTYKDVAVADMLALSGLPYAYTDNEWGWSDLRGAGVDRNKEGFFLVLPLPKKLKR